MLRAKTARVVPDAESLPPDREVVQRIRDGDVAMFEALVRTYHRPLHTFLTGYLGSAAPADDLLQDLFLKIWRNHEHWQVRSHLRGYLYAAARNAALVYRRHERVVERCERDALRDDEPVAMSTGTGPAERWAEAGEVSDAVDRALARLPERCRMAATLRLQHQLTYVETAEAMGVSVKAVERLYTKALRLLRIELVDHR